MLKNSLIYILGLIISKALFYLLTPLYTNYLNPREYGIISLINYLVAFMSIFFILSLDAALTRKYINLNDELKKRYVSVVLGFLILHSFVLSLVLVLLKDCLTNFLLKDLTSSVFLYVVLFLAGTQFFILIPLAILRIEEKPIQYILFNFLENLLMVFFTFYSLDVMNLGVDGALYALVCARLLMIFASILILKQFFSIKSILSNLKTNLKNLNESLRFSLPLLPHNIAIALTNLSDRFIIKHYLGLSALGIYSLGIQFHSLVLLVVTAFSQAFTPRYYKLMNERSLSQKQFNNTFIFSLVSITLISIIVFQVFPIVINLITNDVYMADYRFVGILLSSGLFQLGYVFSFAEISFFKKNKIIMYVTVTSVILNILFNFILIPKFHLTGAALAMSLTLFVRFCLLFYYSTKLTRHIYRWPLMEGFGILSLYLLDITISFVVDNINFQIYVNTIIVFIIIFYTIIRLDINEKFYFKIKKRG